MACLQNADRAIGRARVGQDEGMTGPSTTFERRMPAEWEPHERTWMAWPPVGYLTDDGTDAAYRAWSAVANAIVRFEPVSMVVDPTDVGCARAWLDPRITLVEAPLDDAWMRDTGPTFVREGAGRVAGVDWVFNGWGAQEWTTWGRDAEMARRVCESTDVPVITSSLVNEGGGIHVNGAGVLLLTKTVQLDEGRNPQLSQSDVERELARTLGVDTFVWLDRGLTRDYELYGTRGHVDIVAAFVNETTVLFHDQRDPRHPDFEVSAQVRSTLEAHGLTAVALPAPTVLTDEDGFVDYSYVNHYVLNDAVILCSFDDHNDAIAQRILEQAYPDREIVLVDAREIFARGGGIHCITQQQPAREV